MLSRRRIWPIRAAMASGSAVMAVLLAEQFTCDGRPLWALLPQVVIRALRVAAGAGDLLPRGAVRAAGHLVAVLAAAHSYRADRYAVARARGVDGHGLGLVALQYLSQRTEQTVPVGLRCCYPDPDVTAAHRL